MSIMPLSAAVIAAARERIDRLTKPVGSLGRLETLAVQLCAISGGVPPHRFERRAILIAAADHGVAAAGVSAYPSEVTVQMVAGFLRGTAAINALARAVKATVFVADFGVTTGSPAHEALLDHRIAAGTADLSRGPAMSLEDVDRALEAGARAFTSVRERTSCQIIALGEMGIANTTSAAAIVAATTGADPVLTVGRGTGIDDAHLAIKRDVVARAVARCAGGDVRSIAAEVGGFEIVGLAGAILAAAEARLPIVLDGYILGAAALLAQRLAPASVGYCIAAHRSQEPGHAIALEALGLEPLLDLGLRLGEASGAALVFPIVEAAARMVAEMLTFEEAGVSDR